MGWGTYENHEGRPAGYAVSAICDHPGCKAKIDRGLGYLCGTQDAISGGGPGCGKYFCEEHHGAVRKLIDGGYATVCDTCKNDPIDDDYYVDEDKVRGSGGLTG
jgi:hypothetical protein